MTRKDDARDTGATRQKSLAVRFLPDDGDPARPDDALETINREFALEPIEADRVYLRTLRLANDQYDRDHERFPSYYLDRFAATLPGKAVLDGHNTRERPLGRFFAARVAERDGVKWLDARFYLPKTDGNAELRAMLDAGVYHHASIGFLWPKQLDCELCGKNVLDPDACAHFPGEVYRGKVARATYAGEAARVEAVEGSLVYLGAQYGAGVTKRFAGDPADDDDPPAGRTLDDEFDRVERRLDAALAAQETLCDRLDSLQTAREDEGRTVSKARLDAIDGLSGRLTDLRAAIVKGPLSERRRALQKLDLTLRGEFSERGVYLWENR